MRRVTARVGIGLALAGAVITLRPGSRANKLVCRALVAAGRRQRYLGGQFQGWSYRLRGRHPDPHVIDTVLADRIRSSLGPLEKTLDVPHVHVMVEHHVALLHGEVGNDVDVEKLEEAVAAIPGVEGVESYLHVGFGAGDTRPSEGRALHPSSDALRRLLAAAGQAGVAAEAAPSVVRAILATFADRLPAGERNQVAAHLPADVRLLFTPPRRVRRGAPARTVHEFVGRVVAATAELPAERAEQVTAAVVGAVRDLVPEEAHDVAAVLPAELRALWQGQRQR